MSKPDAFAPLVAASQSETHEPQAYAMSTDATNATSFPMDGFPMDNTSSIGEPMGNMDGSDTNGGRQRKRAGSRKKTGGRKRSKSRSVLPSKHKPAAQRKRSKSRRKL